MAPAKSEIKKRAKSELVELVEKLANRKRVGY